MEMPGNEKLEVVQEPTITQAERAATLKRFNWLYVYAPIIAGAAIIAVITILLIYIALRPDSLDQLITISAVADSVIILTIIPTMVICAIVPVLFLVTTFQFRKQGTAPIRQTQRLFWRLDIALNRGQVKVTNLAQRIGRPFINAHAMGAYIKNLFQQLLRLFKRS